MSGSWNISGDVSMDPAAPLTATASATTTVSAQQNATLSSFNPIASVTGGYPPYTYIVSSGILPAGLALNSSTGLVSGIPTTVQNSAPTVFAVRDSSGTQAANTATVNFAVSTLPVVATVGTTATVNAIQNTAITSFNPFSSVSNGFAPYTYSVSSGTLPTGVTINSSTGLVSGTPTATQIASNVVFSVKDSQNNQASTTATVSFTVNLTVTATAGATTSVIGYPSIAITSFNPFSSVSGGYSPYVYSVSSGTLPEGITINSSTGLVSGTPTTLQSASSVTFSVQDSLNNQANITKTVNFTVIPTFTIQYLVIAGGGGGGSTSGFPGGGGAGGMTSGSVGSLTAGRVFTITVGTGGCGGIGSGNGYGLPGNPSSLTSPAPLSVTTQGGGGGGSSGGPLGPSKYIGSPGGSGGGTAGNGPGFGPGGTGTPGQGNPGGATYNNTYAGGGGGGAGGAGQSWGPGLFCGPPGGNGGAGALWPYTGIYYAGGGGGAGWPTRLNGLGGGQPPASPTLKGGGGDAMRSPVNPPGSLAQPGVPGTGGGGGAAQQCGTVGGAGGPGTVILAVPTPNYPGSAPGATVTTPPAAPGYTVITFTAPGTYTA
jgi:hypothetical protein